MLPQSFNGKPQTTVFRDSRWFDNAVACGLPLNKGIHKAHTIFPNRSAKRLSAWLPSSLGRWTWIRLRPLSKTLMALRRSR